MRVEMIELLDMVQARGDQDISFSDLDKMTFTVAFMKVELFLMYTAVNTDVLLSSLQEILRFHPALPMSQREAARDVVVPLAQPVYGVSGERIEELRISKGEVIIINTCGYNR
jgi:cytochrome P450